MQVFSACRPPAGTHRGWGVGGYEPGVPAAAHAAHVAVRAYPWSSAVSWAGSPSYPVPSSLASSPQPLMPAKITRIAAEPIAPSNIGSRVR